MGSEQVLLGRPRVEEMTQRNFDPAVTEVLSEGDARNRCFDPFFRDPETRPSTRKSVPSLKKIPLDEVFGRSSA